MSGTAAYKFVRLRKGAWTRLRAIQREIDAETESPATIGDAVEHCLAAAEREIERNRRNENVQK